MRVLLYICIAFWLVGCTKMGYVPVEKVRTEIEYRDRLQRDSIHIHDSINVYQKGDTVFRDRWHTEYKDRLLRDTINIYKTDSVQVPYPVDKIVEVNRLRWYQETLMWIGVGALLVLMLWLIRRKK